MNLAKLEEGNNHLLQNVQLTSCGKILLYVTSVFTFKMPDHYKNHRCLEYKNVSRAIFCPIDGRPMLVVYVKRPQAVHGLGLFD